MRTHKLKPGDPVRFVVSCHFRGCQIGDKGTVREPLNTGMSGALYYRVSMEKTVQARMASIFSEDEIEPDV